MRFFTLLLFSVLLSTSLSAQFVVVNSPDDLAGSYSFSTADFGISLSDTVITADAVLANSILACEELVNADEVAGKIALIDRGDCEFGLKVLNAEKAGAVAAIVFNSAANAGAGTSVMGAGAVGSQVTIPSVMLSYEDGQLLRAAAEAGTLNITLGTIVFANDLGTSVTSIIAAPYGTVPVDQLGGDKPFTVNPGAIVSNFGTNDATNVVVTATVKHTSAGGTTTEVYSESEELATLEVDSSAFFLLSPYSPTSGIGRYELTYQITSDSTDEVPIDNTVTAEFTVSNNVFSKARWNPNTQRPFLSTAYTISGGGPIEFLSGFHIPQGVGYKIDSALFYVSTALPSLAGVPIEAFVYEWNDLNEDGSASNEELAVVAFASYVFPDDFATTSSWLQLPLLDFATIEDGGYVIEEDGKNYFLGIRYQGPDLVYIGFDLGQDLTQYINLDGITDLDLPYIGINGWNDLLPDIDGGFLFSGLRASVNSALIVSAIATDVKEVLDEAELSLNLYPNPVSEELVVELKLQEQTPALYYQVTDALGRTIFTTKRANTLADKVIFNVNALPNGQYFLTVKTAKGHRTSSFVVNH